MIKISYQTSTLHPHIFLDRFDELSQPRTTFLDLAMGILCQYCKVLEIDDASWGGFRDESIPGKNVAAFSGGTVRTLEDSHYLHDRYHIKYPRSYGPVKIQYFTCQYGREDTFPELPDLKESAAGCGFCALLRDWIRWYANSDSYRTFGDPERTIVIRSLSYTWYEAIRENGVPLRIFGGLNPEVCWDDGSAWYFKGVDIRIDAPKGKSLPMVLSSWALTCNIRAMCDMAEHT